MIGAKCLKHYSYTSNPKRVERNAVSSHLQSSRASQDPSEEGKAHRRLVAVINSLDAIGYSEEQNRRLQQNEDGQDQ
jgi:hypothetical protein